MAQAGSVNQRETQDSSNSVNFEPVPSETHALGIGIQTQTSSARGVSARPVSALPGPTIPSPSDSFSAVLSTRSDGPPDEQSMETRTRGDNATPSHPSETGLISRFMSMLGKALQIGSSDDPPGASMLPPGSGEPKRSRPDSSSALSRSVQGRGVTALASADVSYGVEDGTPSSGVRRRSVSAGIHPPRLGSSALAHPATRSTDAAQALHETLPSPRQHPGGGAAPMDSSPSRSPRRILRPASREVGDNLESELDLRRDPALTPDTITRQRSGAETTLGSPTSSRRVAASPTSRMTAPTSSDAATPSAGVPVAPAVDVPPTDGADAASPAEEQQESSRPRYKPQRSLSHIFDQVMTAFPKIQQRDTREIDTLMMKFVAGVCVVIVLVVGFGCLGLIPVVGTFYYAGLDVAQRTPQPTSTQSIVYDKQASNVTISWAIRGENVWKTMHGYGHDPNYYVKIADKFHWLLLAIGATLLLCKVGLPFFYYIMMFKRCEKQLRPAFFIGFPVLVMIGIFLWVFWLDHAFKNKDSFKYFFAENLIVLLGFLALWLYMSVFRERWKWAKFRAAVPAVFIPLITLAQAPFLTERFIAPIWMQVSSQVQMAVLVGGAFPMIFEMSVLPLLSMTVLVWNYYGIVKLEPLLFCIFPVAFFLNFHLRFFLYSINHIVVFTLSTMLLAVVNRLHRLSIDLRIAAIADLTNVFLSFCSTFPRMKIFNMHCILEPASLEVQAQIAIQDLVIQYAAATTAAVAAIVMHLIPTLYSDDRTDRIVTYLVVQYLVDLLADVCYMLIAVYRTKYPFGGKPLVGAWVRRCEKYNYLICVLACFAGLFAMTSLTTNLCQVSLIQHGKAQGEDVARYATMMCKLTHDNKLFIE